MRKIKEVLRLRFGLGLHQEQIARSCSIGQAAVHRYLEKAAAAKLRWPLADDLDDQQLDALLFPARPLRTPSQPRPGLDFGSLQAQLQTHKHLTLQLLWEEYRETHHAEWRNLDPDDDAQFLSWFLMSPTHWGFAPVILIA